jgi:hypothetical protein
MKISHREHTLSHDSPPAGRRKEGARKEREKEGRRKGENREKGRRAQGEYSPSRDMPPGEL